MDLEEKIKKLIEYGEKSNNNLENEGDNLQNFVENVLSLDDVSFTYIFLFKCTKVV